MGFHRSSRIRLSMAACLIAVVAGCGGGGGGSAGVPSPPAPAPKTGPLNFGVHSAAAVVIGQSSFETETPGNTLDKLSFPIDSAVTADGRLIVVDSRNDMLKTFSNYDTTATGRAADFEVALAAATISTAGSRVVSAIGTNLRIFDSWPTGAGLLQPTITGSGRSGCDDDAVSSVKSAHITPLGRLIVADTENHRVLIWDTIPERGVLGEANIVIGQRDMLTCNENGGGAAGTPGVTSRAVLSSPWSVWSDDVRLIVSDRGNNRVLVWNTFPGTFQEANRVIGQADFDDSAPNAGGGPSGHTLNEPATVDVNEHGQLAVADTGNNRVLVWNAIPQTDGKAADQVIGQRTFEADGSGVTSAQSLFRPSSARFHKRNLIVAEPERDRVLIFRDE